jgi:alcohol dehydrogenase class IV
VDVVLAVGGGSVLDAGKAISAMLLQEQRVKTFLEEVGTGEVHDGRKVPFIAVPTTSGSGSEATSNAVLSSVSENGFKKSLRHQNFVPDISIIDPGLMLSCPAELSVSTGLDAIVQLVESYVSTKANLITDALAWSGLVQAAKNFLPACGEGSDNLSVRAGMAYASLMSGITLSNAGLGVVHGFAASIGGYFRIPHAVICACLFAPSMKFTIENVRAEDPEHIALRKFSKIGYVLIDGDGVDIAEGCNLFIETIYKWVEDLKIPKLGSFGVEEMHVEMLVGETGQKNNPVILTSSQLRNILIESL